MSEIDRDRYRKGLCSPCESENGDEVCARHANHAPPCRWTSVADPRYTCGCAESVHDQGCGPDSCDAWTPSRWEKFEDAVAVHIDTIDTLADMWTASEVPISRDTQMKFLRSLLNGDGDYSLTGARELYGRPSNPHRNLWQRTERWLAAQDTACTESTNNEQETSWTSTSKPNPKHLPAPATSPSTKPTTTDRAHAVPAPATEMANPTTSEQCHTAPPQRPSGDESRGGVASGGIDAADSRATTTSEGGGDESIASAAPAAGESGAAASGTFSCPACGRDTPHSTDYHEWLELLLRDNVRFFRVDPSLHDAHAYWSAVSTGSASGGATPPIGGSAHGSGGADPDALARALHSKRLPPFDELSEGTKDTLRRDAAAVADAVRAERVEVVSSGYRAAIVELEAQLKAARTEAMHATNDAFDATQSRDAALARAEAAERERDDARADVIAAAGKLFVDVPAPGTDEARMLLANMAMRRERDAAIDKSRDLAGRLNRAIKQRKKWRKKAEEQGRTAVALFDDAKRLQKQAAEGERCRIVEMVNDMAVTERSARRDPDNESCSESIYRLERADGAAMALESLAKILEDQSE